ncbi:peptidoglycan D,D-transpeptidase FtsI family protein [Streptomyces albireticuli]|uniref:Penicillin-binding protein n=1 Tax=Streptomyces albireticuli TaxID=1940 RepID=A0A2A2DAQ9_9ACTN|nr:penicillin-binding protein 2 [Streptomyces albireticuli]MCD9141743.1 penicillin-binding protein 2 [Streptomyces albireticuli]MCD9163313.1 penicillin-binding protein 2 [Streptomyces albireticuli]MCD9189917.1 penicillin-binding protein 2 [Streptomyces albireticuli]PAU48615.1 penicillin-binding protein [Streptomyces albireticuli]
MNRPLRHVAVFALLLVLAVLVRATWVQAAEAGALDDNPHNRRQTIAAHSRPLGNILVSGKPVTGSTETDGELKYKRTYTDGEMYAPVTGYLSQAYGATQLESLYESVLTGRDSRLRSPADALTGKEPTPGDVLTTLDPAVQKAAYEALGGKTGAAVALDPATGAILGMASTPSYDPGRFAGNGSADRKAWEALQNDKNQPMLNRALRQTYPPGSTFKLVVAAAALENGLYTSVDQPTDSPDPYLLPGTTTYLRNENTAAPCANASIRTALQYSCNNVFGHLAERLGQQKVAEQAKKLGFGDGKLDTPVRAAESLYPTGMDKAQTALSGIGQFDVRATPLQMAMVSSAIANDGLLMTPRLVDRVTDGTSGVLEKSDPKEYGRAMSADTAQQLRSAMRTVVEKGTGTNARIDGLTVGGKTGTAQHGVDNSGTPYAWFVSYAQNAQGKQIAVAVVIADSDAARSEVSGNGLAAPVAEAIMRAGLAPAA